uniref:Sodium/potassium-transporting ATPase subunit beta n=1 Tax=Glossina palpalis gambiensis TaxID=67801 RepID=A0A1B0AZV1_9MUSC
MPDQPVVLQKRFRHEEEEERKYEKEDNLAKKLFNVEEGQLCGRTPFSWFLIFLFIIIFWICIVFYWSLLYYVFASGLSGEYPRYFMDQPGLSFEPCIIEKGEKRIEYSEGSEKHIDLYTEKIFKSLAKYGEVPPNRFGLCTEESDFGYHHLQPCFFLKVNKVIGFKIDAYKTGADMPKEAPEALRTYADELSSESTMNKIWISCTADPPLQFLYFPAPYVEDKDIELNSGTFYVPKDEWRLVNENLIEEEKEISRENSNYYNLNDFKRIIAVRPSNLTHNTNHSIKCQMWAKNIVQETQSTNSLMNRGYIRFRLGVKAPGTHL